MKYSCSMCGKQYHPCVIDVKGIVPEAPYSCPYANDRTEVKADWKEMKEQDFEMNGLCSDCSNCVDNCDNCNDASCFSNHDARQSHEAPSMSEKLRSAIDAANEKLNLKDPKSRYYDAGGIETLDIIKAKLTPDQYIGFLLGNIIKYSCRCNHKGSFDRDIEKVKFYGKAIFGTLNSEDRK